MIHEKYYNINDGKVTFQKDGENLWEQDDVIFLCPFGSHLYGTEGEESDIDFKGVYLADIGDIFLKKDTETRNLSSGELDVELIELRKFLKDAKQGQTYAVELINCPDSKKLYSTSLWDEVIVGNQDKLISSKVKPFVGYCKTQAKKYSMKGKRLRELEKFRDILVQTESDVTMKNLPIDVDKFDHIEYVQQEIRGQEKATLLRVANKKYNMGDSVDRVMGSVESEIDKYGQRSHRAKDGIDWKATYHAYRVAYELDELIRTGKIQFPLKDADYLKSIKNGKVPIDRVKKEITELIEEVNSKDISLDSDVDEEFWDNWVLEIYGSKM